MIAADDSPLLVNQDHGRYGMDAVGVEHTFAAGTIQSDGKLWMFAIKDPLQYWSHSRIHLVKCLQARIVDGEHDQALPFVFFSQLYQVGFMSVADGAVMSEEVHDDNLSAQILQRNWRR